MASRTLSALAAALLLGSGAALAQQPPGPGPNGPYQEQRQALKRQQVEALTRLTPSQRRAYVQAQRGLEQRLNGQRLSLLDQSERCLGQASGQAAVQACVQTSQQRRMELRRQEMTELMEIQRRFGLPSWSGRKSWDGRPAPQPVGPTSRAQAPYGYGYF
jgi:hypothetical protein